jgi:hypothetical protein
MGRVGASPLDLNPVIPRPPDLLLTDALAMANIADDRIANRQPNMLAAVV